MHPVQQQNVFIRGGGVLGNSILHIISQDEDDSRTAHSPSAVAAVKPQRSKTVATTTTTTNTCRNDSDDKEDHASRALQRIQFATRDFGRRIVIKEAQSVKRRIHAIQIRTQQQQQQQQQEDDLSGDMSSSNPEKQGSSKRRKLTDASQQRDANETDGVSLLDEQASIWNQATRMKRLSFMFRQLDSIQQMILHDLQSIENDETCT